MSIQHKILVGYFISAAVIGSMVAILFHERNRVHEIKNEMLGIKNLQHDVSAVHRHITILSTHGETAVGWDEKNIADYRSLRLHVDSMLNEMSDKYNEFANKEQIDTLRHLWQTKKRIVPIHATVSEAGRIRKRNAQPPALRIPSPYR